MSDRSDNSLRLAQELRSTALKNLGRSTTTHRSAITGKLLRPSDLQETRDVSAGTENETEQPPARRRYLRRFKSM